MIGEASTLSRIVELLHIPAQHSPETLREVYTMISTACGYDNFIRQPGGARLELRDMRKTYPAVVADDSVSLAFMRGKRRNYSRSPIVLQLSQVLFSNPNAKVPAASHG